MSSNELTIGRLAKAADVGIETIRYYQRRKLLPAPPKDPGTFRYYPESMIERILFIKRGRELAFSLDEIGELLKLNDGTDRKSIRRIAATKREQIQKKISDLSRLEKIIDHLVVECEHAKPNTPCPIIGILMGTNNPASAVMSHENSRVHSDASA